MVFVVKVSSFSPSGSCDGSSALLSRSGVMLLIIKEEVLYFSPPLFAFYLSVFFLLTNVLNNNA